MGTLFPCPAYPGCCQAVLQQPVPSALLPGLQLDCWGVQRQAEPCPEVLGEGCIGLPRMFSTSQSKKGKDPNAPKRPMSAYMLWLNANREKIKSDHPGISITDLSKKAGELWKAMSKEKKEVRDGGAQERAGPGTGGEAGYGRPFLAPVSLELHRWGVGKGWGHPQAGELGDQKWEQGGVLEDGGGGGRRH